jgi:hypothetical protein
MDDVVCHLVTDIVSFVCVPNKLEKRVEGKMSKRLCILYNPHVREADYGSIRFYFRDQRFQVSQAFFQSTFTGVNGTLL